MNLLPAVQLRCEIIEPDRTFDANCDLIPPSVPGMTPGQMRRAKINVDPDGYTYVTWLEVAPGWKKELFEWFIVILKLISLVAIAYIFWIVGAVLFVQITGGI